MTAVSQSYPNYLGGLNEQPDELKKPGQLVEALNVIPDPTIGLTRRPGFKSLGTIPGADPTGTWFEVERSNQLNDDYIYYGCVNRNGTVRIVNQDCELQNVKYTDIAITPHQRYKLEGNTLSVTDDNDNTDEIEVKDIDNVKSYFKHSTESPLKYCVSKNHIIFTNPEKVPSIGGKKEPSDEEKTKYYSFVNLKVIDTENYNYKFIYFTEGTDSYRYIKKIDLETVNDILGDYDKDLTYPLEKNGPFRFTLEPQNVPAGGSKEDAVVEVAFTGYPVQLKSSDGDGYRNEARYTWNVKVINAGKGFKKGQVYKEKISKGDAGGPSDLQLTFKIEDVNSVTATNNVEIQPGDVSNKDADEILLSLAQQFKSAGGVNTAIVTGNGIYLENDSPFSVSTSEIAVADVMNSQKVDTDVVPIVRVNSVGELPVECYAGFIVEVTNSFNNENNYYLEYKAESETNDLDLTKSDGYWEEIRKPFEPFNPENSTLPHMITIARTGTDSEFSFVVSPIKYIERSAGTVKDNPSMFRDTSPITAINYYKNRLFFFTSIGTVITTRAGEIDNLFLNTAVNVSLIDPIDVVANANQRVPIHGSAVVNNGLVLFGDTEQYSVTTNGDILSSETVNVTKIANYTFDSVSSPIYLGTNLAFISSGLSRFYEMTNVYDRGPVDINERSQQIAAQFGQGFNIPSSSREQSMALVYKKYGTTASRSMYMYRFRQENSQESSQTSWVRWQVDRNIAYVSQPQDKVIVFVSSGLDPEMYIMDGSTLNIPGEGIIEPPTFMDGYSDTKDGVPFNTVIRFPTIYASSKGANPQADTVGNLTIHRVKVNTTFVGPYKISIDRLGYDPYEIQVEHTPADKYNASPYGIPPYVTIDSRQLQGQVIETIPIYTRNTNLTLTLHTDFDGPFTLNSMTWEGDYNRPYYKSV